MLFASLAAITVVLLAMSLVAWRWNIRHREQLKVGWPMAWRWRWPVGIALGVLSVVIGYPQMGDDGIRYFIHGIPMPAFAFDDDGRDYVGPISLPISMIDFATLSLLPQSILWFLGHRKSPRVGTTANA